MPGYGGGANWPGAAVDPETATLYVTAMNHLWARELQNIIRPSKGKVVKLRKRA